MESAVINTRTDLDALAGTPAHADFMGQLSATLWRLELDAEAGTWRVIEDDSVIARYGLTRADFPAAQAPVPPEYVAPVAEVPAAVSMRQARLALLGAGLLASVNAALAAMPGAAGEAARIEWEYAHEIRRDSPLVAGLSGALAISGEQLDALFVAAAGL
ncbi:MAG: hypothetical protein IPG66_05860 [Hydrogenophilales bacterium]|nr:hypothetical protein [Hydrogenophilales bacterium]